MTLLPRAAPILTLLMALTIWGGPARAQSGAEANAWAAWCTSPEIGGRVEQSGGNPICVPPSASSGGGYSSDQQAMLNLAGQLGQAIGAGIRQSFQNYNRQQQINRMQAEWEMMQARRQAAADLEQQRLRNQALLANMHGTINNSELGRTQVQTEELRLRTTDEMFTTPGNARGTLRQDVPVSAPLDLAEIEAANEEYFGALEELNDRREEVASREQTLATMRNLQQEVQLSAGESRIHAALAEAGSEERGRAEAAASTAQQALDSNVIAIAEMERALALARDEETDARNAFNRAQTRRTAAGQSPASSPP